MFNSIVLPHFAFWLKSEMGATKQKNSLSTDGISQHEVIEEAGQWEAA